MDNEMIAFNTNQMEVHQNLKTSNPIKANVLGIASTSCLYHVYGSMNASISLLDPTGKHDRNDFVLLKECGNLVFHDYDKLRDKEISYDGFNGWGRSFLPKKVIWTRMESRYREGAKRTDTVASYSKPEKAICNM